MKVIGTGLSGLVGTRICQLLPYEFEFIDRKHDIDIREKEKVLESIFSSKAPFVFHLAAKTDVDSCEKDKELKENGEAWQINVIGTKNIVEACKRSSKKILYVSTDFVFDGNAPSGGYTEKDSPLPINWYGQTKFEAEKIVMNTGIPFLILRIAYPYRIQYLAKKDFVRFMLAKLQNKETAHAIIDHIMTPTYVDDIAAAIQKLIESSATGIYHIVGSQFISPFDAAMLLAQTFHLDTNLIKKTTRDKFFKNRAPRPFNLSLKNDKIRKLGVEMRSFEGGLKEIKKQTDTPQ